MTSSLHQLLAAFDADRPLDRAETIPGPWYFDAELADAERRTVFGSSWQTVGRTEQVARPGSYLTADVAGEPILVVRGDDGVLRAFFNVCRHRAAPLLTAPCGQASKLRCRYHGWTYDLTGRARGTPEFDGVCDFRREDNGLVVVDVLEREPLVWVRLGGAARPLDDALGPLRERLAVLASLRFNQRITYEVACNWKVYVDNYLDGGYHINTVHPGLGGVIDYSQYRNELFEYCNLQRGPLKPPGEDATAVAAVRPGGEAQYWWLFPNLMLNLYDGVADTNLVLPLGVDRCLVHFDFYFAAGTDETFIRDSIAVSDRIQREDQDICAEVQFGLRSRSFRAGRFSVKREATGYHFHQLLARALRPG